jgi:inosine-uridine nucleoside N-ribohydrolase
LHLDTDLGGDPDDACALTMLLGLPDVELTGITTTIDPGGRRAGCTELLLRMLRRTDVPVVAGAAMSFTRRELAEPDERLFPTGVVARPAAAGAALDVLERTIADGVRIAAIGPLTNLAALELLRPGVLAAADLVVMGGWVEPPGSGLPGWGPDRDFNVQWDTRAAEVVATAAGALTLVTLPAALDAPLSGRDLPRLRALGPVGELLARQSEARRGEAGYAELAREHPRLPDDLVNFHFDPVACSVAAGWEGVRSHAERLLTSVEDGVLHWRVDDDGRPVEVVTEVDGTAFADHWLAAVERATSG